MHFSYVRVILRIRVTHGFVNTLVFTILIAKLE